MEEYLKSRTCLFKITENYVILRTSSNAQKGDSKHMRNQAFRKFIVYAMIAIMLVSTLMMGLSFVL